MDDGHTERLMDLEVRLAFQDQFIRELDEFVRALSGRLERVERELATLAQTARSPGLLVGPSDDPPPHY